MDELPERFDSKRELDAWLARVVDTYTKYTGPDNAIQNPLDAKEYTTKREHALDLLEVFCEAGSIDASFLDLSVISIKTYDRQGYGEGYMERVLWEEPFDNPPKIDPLAVSVAIYKAFKQIEGER